MTRVCFLTMQMNGMAWLVYSSTARSFPQHGDHYTLYCSQSLTSCYPSNHAGYLLKQCWLKGHVAKVGQVGG